MQTTFNAKGNVRAHTTKITATDQSTKITTLVDTALGTPVDWAKTRAIEIHIENNDCRVAFNCEAANGATPIGGLRYVGQRERIPNADHVMAAQIINATAGSSSVLMVDIEY